MTDREKKIENPLPLEFKNNSSDVAFFSLKVQMHNFPGSVTPNNQSPKAYKRESAMSNNSNRAGPNMPLRENTKQKAITPLPLRYDPRKLKKLELD